MFGFDSKDFLFVFPRFCLFLVGFNSQPWVFLHTYYQPISQKTKKLKFFFGCVIFPFFVMVWYGFKSQKKCVFCFLHICYQPISPKKQKKLKVFFFCCYGLIWFQKPKVKKKLEFLFFAYMLSTISQKNKKNSCVFCFFAFVVMVWYVMQYLIQRVPDTLRKSWGQWGML